MARRYGRGLAGSGGSVLASILARLRGHLGGQAVLTTCKRYPVAIAAVLFALFYAASWWVTPQVTSTPISTRVVPERETELQRQQLARQALRDQQQEVGDVRQLKAQVEQQTLVQKTLTGMLTEVKDTLQRQEQERKELEKRLAAERARQHTDAPRRLHEEQTPPKAPRGWPGSQPATGPAITPGPTPKLRVLSSDRKEVFAPPPANRSEVAYIGAGCHAEMVIGTGVMVSSRAGGKMDMMLAIKKEAYCPEQLMGPGQVSRVTALPIQGCLLLGEAVGDLASSRVEGRMHSMSCVMTDGTFFDEEIDAYITDMDLTFGVVGTVHHHASAVEFKAFLTAMLQEGSAFLAAARSKVVVATNASSGAQPFAGVESGLNQLTALYIQQMQYLFPTLWVPSKTRGYVVFKKGVSLPGLPTAILVTGDHR